MKSKGEIISGMVTATVEMLDALAKKNDEKFEYVRGRDIHTTAENGDEIINTDNFVKYLMSGDAEDASLLARFIRWATLDTEHEYERAEREAKARAAAKASTRFKLA